MFSSLLIFLLTVFVNVLDGNVLIDDFFPFGPDHGDRDMKNETRNLFCGSSPRIELPTPFKFYSKSHNTLFVNVNGDISFDNKFSYGYERNQTNQCHPTVVPADLIIPFWAFHDIRTGGSISYRTTANLLVLNKAKIIIKSAYPDFPNITELNWAFLATWYRVPFCCNITSYNTNTYQIALISDGNNSFVIFNYNRIEWTTGHYGDNGGDENGLMGLPARAGLQSHDDKQYLFPGSCTPGIINITRMSNVNHPGRFVLKVDGPDIITPNPQKATTSVTKAVDNLNYSSTTNSVEHADFRKHHDKIYQILVGLRKRSANDCSKLVKRAALYEYCLYNSGLIDSLLLELKMTKSNFELNLMDKKIQQITFALNEIEKDT